jgi:hypothetical protein
MKAWVLEFLGFMRRSELTALKMADVSFTGINGQQHI